VEPLHDTFLSFKFKAGSLRSASALLVGYIQSRVSRAPDCQSWLANTTKKTHSFRCSRGRPAGREATGPHRDARRHRGIDRTGAASSIRWQTSVIARALGLVRPVLSSM
jgi:hypothetical protein